MWRLKGLKLTNSRFKPGFKPSLPDTIRANNKAMDYYSLMSGKTTPDGATREVKEKVTRGPRKKSNKPLESEPQRDIIKFLCHHPSVAIVERINSGAIQSDKYFVRFHILYSRDHKGRKMRKSDVCGMLTDGRYYAVEVKRPGWTKPKDQREQEQMNYVEYVRHCGGIGLIATCVDDVISEFKRLGV